MGAHRLRCHSWRSCSYQLVAAVLDCANTTHPAHPANATHGHVHWPGCPKALSIAELSEPFNKPAMMTRCLAAHFPCTLTCDTLCPPLFEIYSMLAS